MDLATPSYISNWVVFWPNALSKLYVFPCVAMTLGRYRLIVDHCLPPGLFENPWVHRQQPCHRPTTPSG